MEGRISPQRGTEAQRGLTAATKCEADADDTGAYAVVSLLSRKQEVEPQMNANERKFQLRRGWFTGSRAQVRFAFIGVSPCFAASGTGTGKVQQCRHEPDRSADVPRQAIITTFNGVSVTCRKFAASHGDFEGQ